MSPSLYGLLVYTYRVIKSILYYFVVRQFFRYAQFLVFTGVYCMIIRMKARLRGKRGYDISSVPFKKLQKASTYRKKRWELKDEWLILEAF